MRNLWWSLTDRLFLVRESAEEWMFGERRSLRALALVRIGTGLAVLGLLVDNFSTRQLWAGEASIWANPARAASSFPEIAILRDATGGIVTVVYVATMLAALAFVLGWRTKIANVLTLVGFIAIVGQNPVLAGRGDFVIRLTLLWLLLTHTSAHWALDRGRRERRADSGRRTWDSEQVLPVWLARGLHHLGLIGLVVQTVVLYMSAGLDKIADSTWRDGTALYTTLQLPEYRTFGWLNDAVSTSTVLLAILTYLILLVQLFFGPLLLNAWTRRFVVTVAVLMNAFLGVVFATPWTSLAIIAVTLLFVSDDTLEEVLGRIGDFFAPVTDWLALRGYDVLDRVDDVRFRVVDPVVDWFRFTILRR